MVDRRTSSQSAMALEVRDLNVYYGASHALQGVNLSLDHGVLSVVGRNGMGKTTLCQAIMGMVPISSGSISFGGRSIVGMLPADIARLGIGYVPQGRRLWPSLTVDEHLRMVASGHEGSWSVERIYSTFPRLAERKTNGGGQLSGGEQQMLAISRALLLNPRLLVMDEPTEGLAPVIVAQVAEILQRLGDEGDVEVLVIEQNIGVATSVSDQVAIMVNGRVNRVMESASLAADRDLQQRLLGVGRHGENVDLSADNNDSANQSAVAGDGIARIYMVNPKTPTRWSADVPAAQLEANARTTSTATLSSSKSQQVELRPLSSTGDNVVLVVGTLDTKFAEISYIADIVKASGLPVRLVDVSTSRTLSSADVPPHLIAAHHPRGAAGVFTSDRGRSVAGMTEAFERWISRQTGIAGIIAAGGSGGTAIAAPAMRSLRVGVPKVIISTVASGDVQKYVGPSDITMMHSVADVQGLNSITRQVLANGANALVGMVNARRNSAQSGSPAQGRTRANEAQPAIGLTMFGVTTTCVSQVTAALEDDYDCLVFHATGVGGQSMEKLLDGGLLAGVLDLTTTEVCDRLVGGILPAHDDRFGAMIRSDLPYIGAAGALDMVNFAAPETVPAKFAGRLFYHHNPQITLMRTTPEENTQFGVWIGERLNQMDQQVRFFLPEGGVSALDAPGQPFHDPAADAALFTSIEQTVRQTSNRQIIRLPHNINAPEFSAEIVRNFKSLYGGRSNRQSAGRR